MLTLVKTISVAAASLRVQFPVELAAFIGSCKKYLGFGFLLLFSFFDDLSEFRNSRHVW